MTATSSSNQSNFWWYIAAAVVLLLLLTVTAYEVSLPQGGGTTSPSPSLTPSPSPVSTPTTAPSGSPTTSSSTTPSTSPSPSGTPTAVTLYAGSVNSGSGTYGFGNTASNITSPGPTLTLVKGTTYTVIVYNSGANVPHTWEISTTKAVAATPLFGAGIDLTNYISPQTSGSVTFTPNQTGNFYYVCTVPGHLQLGMWGKVVVTA